MGLIVPENTFLEVGPIGFYTDSDEAFDACLKNVTLATYLYFWQDQFSAHG